MSVEKLGGSGGGIENTGNIVGSSSTTKPRPRLVTREWLHEHRRAISTVEAQRTVDRGNTKLLIPAAQHPLVDGVKPGKEFEQRLVAALQYREKVTKVGDSVAFFLTGNRHHDSASGQTDGVALYDAAGKWLMDEGVPAEELHGKDWIDASQNPQVYNGADEIRVAAEGFYRNPQFRRARYFCSPGQSQRAEMYGLAYKLPLDVVVTSSDHNPEQFHTGFQHIALNGLTRTIDPYGAMLATRTQDRIPADGITGTLPELLPAYQNLPWYAGRQQ